MTTMTVDSTGKGKIIKGQPLSVVVSISGEDNIQDTVQVTATPPKGITLLKTFPGKVLKKVFYQKLIFQADESSDAKTIPFTSDSPSKAKTTATYTPTDNPLLIPDSCILRGTPSYLYDQNPVSLSGQLPTSSNPYILASINPIEVNNRPISKYDIQIRATGPVRIFTVDDAEIFPYEIGNQKQYYDYLIPKPSTSAVNIKIYATKGIAQFVCFETIFSKSVYNQKQIMFITTSKISTSDNFEPPTIEETYQSSTLTRPDQPDYFHFMIPQNNNLKPGDFIIGFVTNSEQNIYKKLLSFGEITTAENGYFKFKVAYSDMYSGTNFISYAALAHGGNLTGSEPNYINYDNDGNNSPDPNDQRRTLKAPEIHDQFGVFIGIYQSINIDRIGLRGIEVWIPADSTDPNQIKAGDSITIKAYISYCVDTKSPARELPIVENHTVASGDIAGGYYKHVISADKLLGYNTIKGDYEGSIAIEYSRLAQNQKSQLVARGFDTVAP
ncbi:hypothetical protein [Xenorhabdus innexi]|uniref:Uncharacterized protein n=1 Tax=Xenorhabdus innexi TaxID=290109 RepID=A0A1N6MZH3_9GAMM|nr:hypothetical protein [Xenorhabdus innexi]PHM30487.1 hypothetical protein Xinn_03290 [Xenorhabdus innexi]SIP74231.1 conserved hypothetical protein [Xenorhabdus innexi]